MKIFLMSPWNLKDAIGKSKKKHRDEGNKTYLVYLAFTKAQ